MVLLMTSDATWTRQTSQSRGWAWEVTGIGCSDPSLTRHTNRDQSHSRQILGSLALWTAKPLLFLLVVVVKVGVVWSKPFRTETSGGYVCWVGSLLGSDLVEDSRYYYPTKDHRQRKVFN